jgi:hypothetical protein
MRRYQRNRISGRARTVLIGVTAAALAGGAFAISTGVSSAGENCAGLDQALSNNLQFIAGQRANPDALSDARIANRQAVVDLINQRRATAGCTGNVAAPAAPAPATTRPATKPPANNTGTGRGVVCQGSTVTLSGEAGAPAASSNTLPVGTRIKVTNLDNNKSVTVRVAGPSGSCALLNNAAFELVREPGKFLIRRAVIERVR